MTTFDAGTRLADACPSTWISPPRLPIISIAAPAASGGASTLTRSQGSCSFTPSIVPEDDLRPSDHDLVALPSHLLEEDSRGGGVPRPETLKTVGTHHPAPPGGRTLASSSRSSRSRICRVVTYLPSTPRERTVVDPEHHVEGRPRRRRPAGSGSGLSRIGDGVADPRDLEALERAQIAGGRPPRTSRRPQSFEREHPPRSVAWAFPVLPVRRPSTAVHRSGPRPRAHPSDDDPTRRSRFRSSEVTRICKGPRRIVRLGAREPAITDDPEERSRHRELRESKDRRGRGPAPAVASGRVEHRKDPARRSSAPEIDQAGRRPRRRPRRTGRRPCRTCSPRRSAAKTDREGLAEHESRLRHRAFRGNRRADSTPSAHLEDAFRPRRRSRRGRGCRSR